MKTAASDRQFPAEQMITQVGRKTSALCYEVAAGTDGQFHKQVSATSITTDCTLGWFQATDTELHIIN